MSHNEVPSKNQWRRRVDFLTGIVAAFSLATLFSRQWWMADLIANLRVQLILGSFAAMSCLVVMRRWTLLTCLGVLTLWQTMAIRSAFVAPKSEMVPTVRRADSIDAVPQQLRVFLANVLARNRDHDLIVEQLRNADPDVFAILELNSGLRRTLEQEFGTTHKYVICETQDDGNFGIGMWSRLPLSNSHIFHLNVPVLPSIEAGVQVGEMELHMVVTHPMPPIGARNFAHRNRHMALLADRLRDGSRDHPGTPVLVLGDLNLTPWSPHFDDFLASSGLRNSAAGRGLQPTWYCWSAFPFGLILDHGLHSAGISCENRTILPANGSDHRALVFDFAVNTAR